MELPLYLFMGCIAESKGSDEAWPHHDIARTKHQRDYYIRTSGSYEELQQAVLYLLDVCCSLHYRGGRYLYLYTVVQYFMYLYFT